ncbi:MAG: pilus assembly protein PilN, partial [Leptolyngbya sp. SIO3F4]|nr:pilus assembly protein PilN [Leptolyngbya sp. SIO3F4]
MYSIDINFLNDREERPVLATQSSPVVRQSTSDRTPIAIGLGVLVAALAGVGGF